MFGLDMLDVLIGVVVVYLLLSLVASAIAEILESFLKYRAKDLHRGIRELLQESKDDPFLEIFYRHPLISALYRDTYESGERGNLPSYIPARTFALAFLDIIEDPEKAKGKADAYARKSTSERLAEVTSLMTAAATEATKAKRQQIEEWFNGSMDRVSGWYKRRTHWILIAIGVLMAITLNVDTIYVIKRFNSDKALREAFVQRGLTITKNPPAGVEKKTNATEPEEKKKDVAPTATATDTAAGNPAPQVQPEAAGAGAGGAGKGRQAAAGGDAPAGPPSQQVINDTIEEIETLGLPLGWDRLSDAEVEWPQTRHQWWAWISRIIGWLLTALAISLGAPFWFDTLNKIMVIRSTVKPTEKSKDEASEDRQMKLKITAG